jgi:hypothetical protein
MNFDRSFGMNQCKLEEIGWQGMGWIGLAEDRNKLRDLEKTVMGLWATKIFGEFLINLGAPFKDSAPST